MQPTPPDPRLLALGHWLRQLRRDRNLSQEEVATRAGLHPNHIGRVERGTKDPRVTTLLRLLDALGVPPAELAQIGSQPVGSPATSRTRQHAEDMSTTSLVDRLDEVQQILLDVRAAVKQERIR